MARMKHDRCFHTGWHLAIALMCLFALLRDDVMRPLSTTRVDNLEITGTTQATGTITADQDINVGNDLSVLGNVTVDGTLDANIVAHGTRVVATAPTVTATSTWTTTAWQSELYDTDTYHDEVTNNNRITIPAGLGGYYLIQCQLQFASNVTGVRIINIRLNAGNVANGGGGIASGHSPGLNGGTSMNISTIYHLLAGDEVQCQGWQSSGGNLNSTSGSGVQESFAVTLIGV